MPTLPCRLCGANAERQFVATILSRYEAAYYRCPACDLVQTEDPHWIEEAYRTPIPATDTGYVLRNQYCTALAASVIERHFDPRGAFVDYGGGYGMLVAAMRTLGYDFSWSDRYCTNLFAPGHVHRCGARAELVTCFETFEHFVRPHEDIERILAISRNVLFSTTLRPERVPDKSWPYYAFEGGQHVSLYSIETLKYFAARYRLNLYSNRGMLHLFTPQRLENFTIDCEPGWQRWRGMAQSVFEPSSGTIEFFPE